MTDSSHAYGGLPAWAPARPRLNVLQLLFAWVCSAISLVVAAWILPGFDLPSFGKAMLVAAAVGVLNALLPPLVASLRLPYTVGLGFILVLVLDALMLLAVQAIDSSAVQISSFWIALLASLLTAAVSMVLAMVVGANDDDRYSLAVIERIARRSGERVASDVPGIVFLEIDGLALPVLRRAMRDGNAPNMARWLADDSHHLIEWETDLSSQTGASQAGILLGSNEDISAFRWVEKERGVIMTCSSPDDCVEIERRHATGIGLLTNGGSSRGNLFSGEADEVILTVSRIERREVGQPRLPRLPRERLQRHPHAGAVLLGGDPRVGRGAAGDPP